MLLQPVGLGPAPALDGGPGMVYADRFPTACSGAVALRAALVALHQFTSRVYAEIERRPEDLSAGRDIPGGLSLATMRSAEGTGAVGEGNFDEGQ